MKNFFLFSKNSNDLSGWKKAIFRIWNLLLPVLAAVCLSCLSLLLAYGEYGSLIFVGYFRHPLIFLLNTLPVLWLMLTVWFLTGRSWIGFLSASAVVLACSLGNYYKLLFRDDPFLFADLQVLGVALKISTGYTFTTGWRVILPVCGAVFGTVFLALFCRARLSVKPRLIAAAAVLLAAVPMKFLYWSDEVYARAANNEYINRWSSTQSYISKGFVYPFIHSVKDAYISKPQGYDSGEAAEMLAEYRDEDIPEDRRVNIIAIQLEAFNDFTKFDIGGIGDFVYEDYHALEAESYTGNLITNIFAGGTVDTERCFLTGFSEVYNFRSNTDSYVRYLKSQGYDVTGSHPCYEWFYNRSNINRYLGFDSYYFAENRYGDITYDSKYFPDIIKQYEERDASSPYFGFHVTYQGHGPYNSGALDGDGGYFEQGVYSDESYYILNNYLNSVYGTIQNITLLTDYLRQDSAPCILVLYGDHNPWLGDSNSVYNELGINLDTSTTEGFYNYYSTRYLIWANGAAKDLLGNDFEGSGPDISPCFLMNELFSLCGWDGPASMQLNETVRQTLPVINTGGFYVENGELGTRVQNESLLRAFEFTQYYRKKLTIED